MSELRDFLFTPESEMFIDAVRLEEPTCDFELKHSDLRVDLGCNEFRV